jgi:hypothetical protein
MRNRKLLLYAFETAVMYPAGETSWMQTCLKVSESWLLCVAELRFAVLGRADVAVCCIERGHTSEPAIFIVKFAWRRISFRTVYVSSMSCGA